jgi:CDP-diacylglycerol---serine O-phosphatidyltransferase
LTSINLISGFAGIFYLYQGRLIEVFCCIIIAMTADLLDGWVARLLKVDGPLGVQLDSLADIVSFGALPASIFVFFGQQSSQPFGFEICFISGALLLASAAYRLAKFNIDTRQISGFIGLPTPAMAAYVTGLLVFHYATGNASLSFLTDPMGILIQSLALSYLMHAPVGFLSVKNASQNKRFTAIMVGLLCISSVAFYFIDASLLLWQAVLLYICGALVFSQFNK